MLSHLQISNFALVERLELEFNAGLTVLTGETGAGKSILLDAISLILGDRADADKVRAKADKADLQATFCLDALPAVNDWLQEHDLAQQHNECLLRRVITKEGRSRAFINGQAVTLQQLKVLGDKLIGIHGQHEHQNLTKAATQIRLLDEFGQIRPLVKELKRCYYRWHSCKETLLLHQSHNDESNARFQLLSYQAEELDALALQEGEIEQLEDEQRRLENLVAIKQNCQHIADICADDENGVVHRSQLAIKMLRELDAKSEALISAEKLFEQAVIHLQEAHNEVLREQDDDGLDPSRLPDVEARLSAIYDIARKHRVQPQDLLALQQGIAEELDTLKGGDAKIEQLQQELEEHLCQYQALAKQLSEARQKHAQNLSKQVNKQLAHLAMDHAKVRVQLSPSGDEPSANGNEDVHFLIATSPGQEPKPIGKIASGGELSRISLAIQVVTANTATTPSLIFDEVDAGIGGTTGNKVGDLLRTLAGKTQVLCVTHLAQVASKAHNHMLVEKEVTRSSVNSSLQTLNEEQKVAEIARMMGGVVNSAQSLAHAEEMLKTA